MNKSDWIDYFEAVNGRSPEEIEIDQAIASGEIVIGSAVNHVKSEALSESAHSARQESHNPGQPQIVYQVPQVPAGFSLFIKQFWAWLVSAWKRPTSVFEDSHRYNGLSAFILQAFMAALTFYLGLGRLGSLASSFIYQLSGTHYSSEIPIAVFFRIFVYVAFVLFAIIFAGFVVQRFVYKNPKMTFHYSFEWYSRLFAPATLLFALSAICVILGIYTILFVSLYGAFALIGVASFYALAQIETETPMDRLYRYVIAGFVNGFIIFIANVIGLSLVGQMLFSSFF